MLLPPPNGSAPALVASCAWLAHVYLTFELQLSWSWLACRALKKDLILKRHASNLFWPGAFVKRDESNKRKENGNMKRLLGQYCWSTEQKCNANNFLDVVKEIDMWQTRKVMKLNEREWSYWTRSVIIQDETRNNAIILRNTNLKRLQRMKRKKNKSVKM